MNFGSLHGGNILLPNDRVRLGGRPTLSLRHRFLNGQGRSKTSSGQRSEQIHAVDGFRVETQEGFGKMHGTLLLVAFGFPSAIDDYFVTGILPKDPVNDVRPFDWLRSSPSECGVK